MTPNTTMKRLFADDGSYAGVAEVTADGRMAALYRHKPGRAMHLTRMTMAIRLGITRLLLELRA